MLGKILAHRRREMQLSQEQVANKAGCSVTVINEFEQKDTVALYCFSDFREMEKICDALDMTVDVRVDFCEKEKNHEKTKFQKHPDHRPVRAGIRSTEAI